jgi:hypothetical protein
MLSRKKILFITNYYQLLQFIIDRFSLVSYHVVAGQKRTYVARDAKICEKEIQWRPRACALGSLLT